MAAATQLWSRRPFTTEILGITLESTMPLDYEADTAHEVVDVNRDHYVDDTSTRADAHSMAA